jgi:hypothetical protein
MAARHDPASRSSEVDAVLAGRVSYDYLNEEQQAEVREAWDEAIAERRSSLDLEREFLVEGRKSWVVADELGNAIIRVAAGDGTIVSMTPARSMSCVSLAASAFVIAIVFSS